MPSVKQKAPLGIPGYLAPTLTRWRRSRSFSTHMSNVRWWVVPSSLIVGILAAVLSFTLLR